MRRAGRRRRSIGRLGALLAVALVIEYLVLPQLAGARAAFEVLGDVDIPLVCVAALLEGCAMFAYAQLLYSLLCDDERPTRRTLLRIQLATRAVSNVVPAGAAAGSGLGYDLLRANGVSGGTAAFALGSQAIGSALVLNALLWAALVVSIPTRGFHPLYVTVALAGAALLSAFAFIVVLVTRGEQRAVAFVRRVARLAPLLAEDQAEAVVRHLAVRVGQLAGNRRLLAHAAAWAAANWLLDAASLWVFLAAFDQPMRPDTVLIAFGVANVLGALPITPGGLGIVEGVVTPLLVGFGAASGEALLAVISWRLVNFWLPIPAGALAYLSLGVGRGRRREQMRALRHALEAGPETEAGHAP